MQKTSVEILQHQLCNVRLSDLININIFFHNCIYDIHCRNLCRIPKHQLCKVRPSNLINVNIFFIITYTTFIAENLCRSLTTSVMQSLTSDLINANIFFIIPYITFIAENLCRNPTTSVMQSSTFRSYNATLVVDGIRRFTEVHCAHTDLNRTKAWLQVDFGQPYSIKSVSIFYRRELQGIFFSFNLWNSNTYLHAVQIDIRILGTLIIVLKQDM